MPLKGTSDQEEMEWKTSDEQLTATEEATEVDNSMDIDEDLEINSLPDSDSTYNLEDDITPPEITPREPSESGSADLEDSSSETSEDIIPKYLFYAPSRSRLLNMEFNRCLLLDIDPVQSTSQAVDPNREAILTPRSSNPADEDDDDSSRYDNHGPAVKFVPLMLNPFDYGRIIPPYLFVSNEDALSEISQSNKSDLDLDSQETERESENLSTYRSILSCDYATEEENLHLSKVIENEWIEDESVSPDVDDEELLWIEKEFWESEDDNDNILYNDSDSSVSSDNSDISTNSYNYPEE